MGKGEAATLPKLAAAAAAAAKDEAEAGRRREQQMCGGQPGELNGTAGEEKKERKQEN